MLEQCATIGRNTPQQHFAGRLTKCDVPPALVKLIDGNPWEEISAK